MADVDPKTIEDDAGGAFRGGEDQRGEPAIAPKPLGRKDPAVTGDTDREKDNVPIR